MAICTDAAASEREDDRQLAAQLADLRTRLMSELGAEQPAETVEAVFEVAVRRLADAHVRSFVPILVERSVRAHFPRGAAGAGR